MTDDKKEPLKRFNRCPKCANIGIMTRYNETGRRENRARVIIGQSCDSCGWSTGEIAKEK